MAEEDGEPTIADRAAAKLGPFKRSALRTLAAALRRDPELADRAMEVGLIDRRWLDDPAGRPLSTTTPTAVVQRFLERSAEQRPSFLPSVGLSALQVLSTVRDRGEDSGVEERLVVAFTDLEGFTAYTSEHGDRAALDLLADHHRTVGPVVRRFGGRIVKRLGDGLMLSFADPADAVLAALELVASAPEGLRLRAGLHLGLALVQGDDLLGHVVNVSARICEAAGGGDVLVSLPVLAEAGDLHGVVVGPARRPRLKGVDEEVVVHRVSSRSTPAAPLVVEAATTPRAALLALRARVAAGERVSAADLDAVLDLL